MQCVSFGFLRSRTRFVELSDIPDELPDFLEIAEPTHRTQTMGNRVVTVGHSSSLNIETITGFTELLRHINNQQWAEASLRVQTHGIHEACTWYVEQVPPRKILDRMLPLHRACELNAPEELMHPLLATFPDAVKLKDHGNGWLPLHFSCSSVGTEGGYRCILVVPQLGQ